MGNAHTQNWKQGPYYRDRENGVFTVIWFPRDRKREHDAAVNKVSLDLKKCAITKSCSLCLRLPLQEQFIQIYASSSLGLVCKNT